MGTEDEKQVLRKYTELGVASIVCGAIGMCCLVLMFLPSISIVHFLVPPLGVLAVIFGAYAYWGMEQDSLGLGGFALGTLLIILWFLLYAYASVTGLAGGTV